jgi:hypothetical protein
MKADRFSNDFHSCFQIFFPSPLVWMFSLRSVLVLVSCTNEKSNIHKSLIFISAGTHELLIKVVSIALCPSD